MPSRHLPTLPKWILQSPPVEWGIMQLRSLLIGALRQGPVPEHIAFVMDGNRRFARSHGIETVEGHHLGFEALAKVLEVCYKSGVKVVTVYAFSIENFKRPKYEVDGLMAMAKTKLAQLCQHGDLLDRYGASVRIIGQRSLLKDDILEAMDRAVEITKGNGNAILNVCVPYTSQDEMTTAIRETVDQYSTPLPTSQQSQHQRHRSFSESHIVHNIQATRRLSNSSQTTTDVTSEAASPPTLKVNRSNSPNSSIAASDTEESVSSSATTLYPDSPNPYSDDPLNNTTQPLKPDIFLSPKPPPQQPSTPSEQQQPVRYLDPETITAKTLTDHMFTASLPPLDLLIRTSGVERLSDFMLWQCHERTDIVFLKCMWPEFDLWSFLPVLVEWQWRRRKEAATAPTSRGNTDTQGGQRVKTKAA